MGPKATKEPNVIFPTTASAMCCFVILSAANLMTERQQATKMAKGPVSMCFFTHAKKTSGMEVALRYQLLEHCLHVLHGLHCQTVLHC